MDFRNHTPFPALAFESIDPENRAFHVVVFKDDQMRAREKNACANLDTLGRFVLNLLPLDTTPKQGGIYNRRVLVASSDRYGAQLLCLSEN